MRTEDGNTALHLATSIDSFALVDALFNAGASCEVRDIDTNCAIHLTVAEGLVEILELLLKHHPETVDLTTKYGDTALHLATKIGSLPLVKVLLEAGASCKIRDNNGDCAIHFAIDGKRVEVLKFF